MLSCLFLLAACSIQAEVRPKRRSITVPTVPQVSVCACQTELSLLQDAHMQYACSRTNTKLAPPASHHEARQYACSSRRDMYCCNVLMVRLRSCRTANVS